MENIDITKYYDLAAELIMTYGPKLLGALAVLIVGLFIIKGLNRSFKKFLEKRSIDPSLKPFFSSIVSALLKTLLVISVLSMLEIEMTSFIAILGAAGLAVGLALSGTLQNFAGGVILLIFKPIKDGDFIETQDYSGTVNGIQIFNTILKTPDNKVIIIPNGGLSTGSLINYSAEATRRVDWTFGIGYGDSTDKAREVLQKLIDDNELILKDPAPLIAVSSLGDSSVNFVVRVWVKAPDYWAVFFDMNEKVYNTFNEVGLNIPFPQMDVHVHNK